MRIPGPGILITKELGINSVSFLDRDNAGDSKVTFGGKKMFKGWIVFLIAAILIAAGISAGIHFWSDANKVQAVANLAGFVATVLLLCLTAVYVGTNSIYTFSPDKTMGGTTPRYTATLFGCPKWGTARLGSQTKAHTTF